ncbi:MAG: Fatty acid hydroxylase family (carotene hydroxylase/sterol desaturase) [Cytophagales bacterium]|jgi:sterol desaturase/sphingolipid hydroxylase (fatty acid hydroxylase superfamily)|nr:sterol desaturase family protein [Bacteroidota bacterium]MBS1979664.1 sterol desaturase family protein [Bacteroidota bacterium]WHZ06917.1 MAG: Fatty acid hydroxylase family (carotene hydroxylase/sterol desaturase) [Cytophagales bacterium]
METIKPQAKGTKRLFKNPILEKMTHTHISVPLVIFFLYSSGLLYWSITHTSLSVGITLVMFFFGLLFFTWVEYVVHRYVFHMSTQTEKRAEMQYIIHGVHHEYPKDKSRLAMPPVLSLTIATLLLFIFRLILGDLVFSFLPGFIVGYALYLLIHYMIHAFQPPKNFFKLLWVNHSIHHYKTDEEVIFGVSSPLWDYVFGTMPKKKKV